MLGIIGGTGLYHIDDLEIIEEIEVNTPFGKPSAPISIAKYYEKDEVFLPRHGKHHQFLPSEVNYRANIFALKKLGVQKIIGVSAVGSLNKNLAPGDIVIPTQYFDHTRGKREYSFFGNGLAGHISTAHPTCPNLTSDIISIGKKFDLDVKSDATYACVEGPRLGTKTESIFLKSAGCDLVGMTNIPEAFLALEAQISYCTICIVTDFDCWLDDPEQHVSVDLVIKTYMQNIERIQILIKQIIASDLQNAPTYYKDIARNAIITSEDRWTDEHREIVEILTS